MATHEPHSAAAPTVLVGEDDSTDHPAKHPSPRFRDQPFVLLPSELAVPKLGLGTWQLDGDDARRAVAAALNTGYRHIDTAQEYGNESDVGRGIEDSGVDRTDIFLTTKIANDCHEPGELVASVETSLELLGTDHVDLLLIHWPTHWDRIAATLSTMAQVQASGLALHIGVSNFTLGQLNEIREFAPLEVLQVECHPYLQQSELRSWCVEHGWAFTAYSPIARGEVTDDDTIRAIADDHGSDPAAITIAWLLSKQQVAAIPKATSDDHVRANFAALHIELSDQEIARIDALDEGRRLIDPPSAPWNS